MDKTTRVERVLWRIAVGCAALLLCAPLTPRTSWTGEGGARMIHSAGWDWISPLSGAVVIVSLIVARRWRPGVTGAVIGAIVASGGFAVAAGAGVGHWLNLMSGSLGVSRWVIHAAPAVAYFSAIAVFGMGVALVLLGSWLHLGDAGPGP